MYIERMWEENHLEKQKREEAQAMIIDNIDRGIPAVVWDVADCEWGIIIGYDLNRKRYETFTNDGKRTSLPFRKLGRNRIDVLSVTIPGERNQRSREESIMKSLQAAVAHADQREGYDRDGYQDGLPGFDLWAGIYERWALFTEQGINRKQCKL